MKTVFEVAKKMTTKTTTANDRRKKTRVFILIQAKYATYPNSFQA